MRYTVIDDRGDRMYFDCVDNAEDAVRQWARFCLNDERTGAVVDVCCWGSAGKRLAVSRRVEVIYDVRPAEDQK